MRRMYWLMASVLVVGFTSSPARTETGRPALPDGQPQSEVWHREEGIDSAGLDLEEDAQVEMLVETEKLVIEALKSETTVQEAPAIVTVIPARELGEMGHRTVGDALGDVPSFLIHWPYYHSGQGFINRGHQMGALVLHNTVDLYDIAGGGSLPLGEDLPVETIRSIEVISGPGGVLWGVNSFIGVVNIVSKTAEDVDGIEASAGWGSGPGHPGRFRGYVMGGESWLNKSIQVMAHASYETWNHGELDLPYNRVLLSIVPDPVGPAYRAGPVTHDPKRSHMVILSGNAQLGPLALYWHVPWGWQYRPAAFTGVVAREHLGEDSIDCTNLGNQEACQARVDPTGTGRFFRWEVWEDYAMLRYRKRLLGGKLSLEARSYYVYYARNMKKYVAIIPSSLMPGGVAVDQDYAGHRGSFIVDTDVRLSEKNRLLVGGEVFYDYMPLTLANFHISSETLQRLPLHLACPPDADGRRCPIPVNFETSRLSTGVFADLQTHLHRTLLLNAGARLQAAPGGTHPMDPVALFSGALVWGFLPNWNLKLNYADGFRPPAFSRINSNGEGITWGANPGLNVERSRALQAEVNASLLHGYGALQGLDFRIDGAYTWVEDSIALFNGINQNTSDRGISSVEFQSRLRLKRGHWLSLGYTFLDIADSFSGKVRSIPNQWLTMRALINLWKRRLLLSTNLTVLGSLENPSKHAPLTSGTQFIGEVDEAGAPSPVAISMSRASDLTMDRISPFPLWNAGLRFLFPGHGMRLDADFYNILDARGHFPVGDFDLTALMTEVPNPRHGFAFFLRGQVSY